MWGAFTERKRQMQYERADKRAQQRNRWLRWTVLGVVLAGMSAIGLLHQAIPGAGRPVPIDSLCPFGAIESAFTFISGAGFIEKTAASSLILLIGTIGLALVYRRSFCGQLCPLGALQGIAGALGQRVLGRRRRPEVPASVDRVARWLKYVILAVFAVWSWQAASLVMRPFDPWATWTHITSAEVLTEFTVGLGVLGVALVGSAVYERFFCKYLCPMGAFLGMFSKVSVLGVRRDADACISCDRCDAACPMNVSVSSEAQVTSAECISCNECVNACPVAGALEVRAAGAQVAPALATVATVVLIGVVVAGTTAAGSFRWLMPSLSEAAAEATVETHGAAPDVGLIKGYMSMAEISAVYGVPKDEFIARWGVSPADFERPMKEVKDAYGFSPDDVKAWVAEELSAR